MLCNEFIKAPILSTISFSSFAYSIVLTGFSMIFMYLLFHLASFSPFTTLAFSFKKVATSSAICLLDFYSAAAYKIYTITSTKGCLSSSIIASKTRDKSRQ
jgi:hypothetical protein